MLNVLRDKKARDNGLQACVLALVIMIVTALGLTTYNNLTEQGITSGFGFLERGTGWDIPFALLDYSIRDPYWRVLVIGFLNTLFIGLISLIFATLFGALIGTARISLNPLLRFLGSVYVEIFRNIPLILQAFFWYAIATHLPPPRRAIEWQDSIFLSSRGVYLPAPNVAPWFYAAVVLGTILIVTAAVFWRRRARASGAVVHSAYGWASCAALLVCMVAALLVIAVPAGEPLLEYPVLKGLRFDGGMRVIPEFSALAIAIIAFGSAYIGEIVRGGFNAVERGQLESAKALGLKPWMIVWHVHLPLALRAIVPPLGNMYVWLMKATTLGIAIGFSDLFMIVSTSINQSGQTIELLALMMTGFFVINYTISLLMNWLNKAIALKGYEVGRGTGAEL